MSTDAPLPPASLRAGTAVSDHRAALGLRALQKGGQFRVAMPAPERARVPLSPAAQRIHRYAVAAAQTQVAQRLRQLARGFPFSEFMEALASTIRWTRCSCSSMNSLRNSFSKRA